MTPVYLFPQMDADYDVTGTERRVYHDVVEVDIAEDGTVLPGSE